MTKKNYYFLLELKFQIDSKMVCLLHLAEIDPAMARVMAEGVDLLRVLGVRRLFEPPGHSTPRLGGGWAWVIT